MRTKNNAHGNCIANINIFSFIMKVVVPLKKMQPKAKSDSRSGPPRDYGAQTMERRDNNLQN